MGGQGRRKENFSEGQTVLDKEIKVIFLWTTNIQSEVDTVVVFLLRNVCCVLARSFSHPVLTVTPEKPTGKTPASRQWL